MGLYWSLWSNAMEFNDEFGTDLVSNPYDQCGITKENSWGELNAGDTKWTIAFLLNAIVYTCGALFMVMMLMTFVFYPCGIIASYGSCFNICAELAAIIVAGVFRFSRDGERCSKNFTNAPGYDSGSSVAKTFEGLFISQCVLFLISTCLIWCMLTVVSTVIALKKAQKDGQAAN